MLGLNLVLDLCDAVLVPLLSEWVEIDDIAALDSAICNGKQRQIFLKNIAADKFTHNTWKLYDRQHYIEWLALRSIKVKVLCLDAFSQTVLTPSLFVLFTRIRKLDHLKMRSCSNLVKIVTEMCCDMQSICFGKSSCDMSDNDFENVISVVKNLKSLDITDCSKLTDNAIHQLILYQPQLSCLRCGGCDLLSSNAISALANGCPDLKTLSTFYKVSDEAVKDVIEQCPLLVDIDLADCKLLTSTVFSRIAEHCLRLQKLDVSGTKAKDCDLISIVTQCKLMEELRIIDCDISDNLLVKIGECLQDSLRVLAVDSGNISVMGLKSIANCHNLTVLSVCGCSKVTDFGLMCVAKKCVKLKKLWIEDCPNVTDVSILKLYECCPSLDKLYCNETQCTDKCVTGIANGMDCVMLNSVVSEELTVNRCYDKCFYLKRNHTLALLGLPLSTTTLDTIVMQSPNMVELQLCKFDSLTDAALISVLDNCPLLEVLIIDDVPLLTANIVTVIAEKCSQLRYLELLYCLTDITDEILFTLVASHPKLVRLKLQANILSDVAVLRVIECCKQLTRFGLFDAQFITDDAIVAVIRQCSTLTSLNVAGCVLLTDTILLEASQYCGRNITTLITDSVKMTLKAAIKFIHLHGARMVRFECGDIVIARNSDEEYA